MNSEMPYWLNLSLSQHQQLIRHPTGTPTHASCVMPLSLQYQHRLIVLKRRSGHIRLLITTFCLKESSPSILILNTVVKAMLELCSFRSLHMTYEYDPSKEDISASSTSMSSLPRMPGGKREQWKCMVLYPA